MKWIKKVASTPLTSVAKVIDSLNAQVNEHNNAPSIAAVRRYINDHIADLYPIGSIYLSVNPGNPSNLFGGTWVQIKDVFLLSAGDTYSAGATGGEATHTLTVAEMPQHRHATPFQPYEVAGSSSGVSVQSPAGTGIDANTSYVGGGQAHNNMPPYLVVYAWKRTA